MLKVNSRLRIKVSKDPWVAISEVCVLLLYAAYFSIFPFHSNYDDFVALVFFLVILFKGKKIKRIERNIIILLFWMLLIAVVSNYAQGIVTAEIDMLNDAFCFLRMFFVYIGVTLLIQDNPERRERVIHDLSKVAKIFVVVSFVCGILTQLGFLGMYERIRFGIKCYTFIFQNASQYGVLVACALSMILFDNPKAKYSRSYEVMALAVLIMTGKGMSLIVVTVYLALLCANQFGFKLSLGSVFVCGILLAIVLRYQIITYLLEPTAPRAILLRYGLLTALRFFPLGSGLATFGSNIAAEHYSPLYVEYGFRGIKALAGNNALGTKLLNDVYLGMIFAEYGVIGTILFLAVLALIFLKIWKTKGVTDKQKNIVVSCFVSACGMVVMAGSLKNMTGELIFFVCAFFCNLCGEIKNESRNKDT